MLRGMLLTSLVLALLGMAAGQAGSDAYYPEDGPSIGLRKCTAPGQCKTEEKKLTIDANWRWTHVGGDYKNCYKGNEWIEEYCPKDDGKTCASKCVLEGNDQEKYTTTYGVEKIEGGVSMKFVNKHEYGVSVGSRLYMLDGEDYEMFMVVNREFAFTADMKELECGMNGAIYFIEMQKNGGKGIGANEAGAKYGTGYCDAQCPHDMKYIDGEANIKGWVPNEKDKSGNMGAGFYGACCNEMDIWEANARAQAVTPHPCGKPSLYRCEGTECGDNDKGERYKGVCDKDGCDFANWRMGDQKFYGKGDEFTINTNKVFTQVTQFITKDGTDDGDMVEIRRWWSQDGKAIKTAPDKHLKDVPEKPGSKKKVTCKGHGDSVTDDFCASQNERFGDYNHFQFHGGNKVMGESLKRGHVLAISLWDDVDVSMMWLDSCFPRDKPCTNPGISRGPCEGGDKSTPTYVRKTHPDAKVLYTDFAVGCLGCTTKDVPKGPPATKPEPSNYKPAQCPYGGAEAPPGGDNDNDDDDSRRRRRSKPPTEARRRRRSQPRRRRRSKETRRRSKPSSRRRSKPSSRRRSTRRRKTTRRRSSL